MVHNFVKIAGAIPHVAVGNCNYNTRQIINLIKQAEEKGVEIVCFPSFALQHILVKIYLKAHCCLTKQ